MLVQLQDTSQRGQSGCRASTRMLMGPPGETIRAAEGEAVGCREVCAEWIHEGCACGLGMVGTEVVLWQWERLQKLPWVQLVNQI